VCFDYVDKHRDNYNKWKSADSFVANYTSEEPILSLIKEEAINKKILSSKAKGFKNNKLISLRIKAQLARTLFDETTMFKVLNKEDNELEQALKVLENYNSLLGK
jgi:carboxyl-terminal processing protease